MWRLTLHQSRAAEPVALQLYSVCCSCCSRCWCMCDWFITSDLCNVWAAINSADLCQENHSQQNVCVCVCVCVCWCSGSGACYVCVRVSAGKTVCHKAHECSAPRCDLQGHFIGRNWGGEGGGGGRGREGENRDDKWSEGGRGGKVCQYASHFNVMCISKGFGLFLNMYCFFLSLLF